MWVDPRFGGTWGGLVVGLGLGLVIALALLSVAVAWVDRSASGVFERCLKRFLFNRPTLTMGSASLDLRRGRARLSDVQWRGARGTLSVPEIRAEFSLREILAGNGSLHLLELVNPLAEVRLSLRGAQDSDAVHRAFARGDWTRWPIQKVSIREGEVRVTNLDCDAVLTLRKIRAEWQPVPAADGTAGFRVILAGKNRSDAPGDANLSVTVGRTSPSMECVFEGVVQQWPLEEVVLFLNGGGMLKNISGRGTFRSQGECRPGSLSVQNHVEIREWKADVATGRKEVMGIPVDKVTAILDMPTLDIEVPISGTWLNPRVEAAPAAERVIDAALARRGVEAKKRQRWARRGGERIGIKIDRAVQRFRRVAARVER